MQIVNISGKHYRDAYPDLSVFTQMRIQASTTHDELVSILKHLTVSGEQTEVVFEVARPMLYGLATVADCVDHLRSKGFDSDSATNICQGLGQWANAETKQEDSINASTWKRYVVDEFRRHTSMGEVLDFIESLVGAVPGNPHPSQEEGLPEGNTLSIKDVSRRARALCGTAPDPVVIAVTTHKYRDRCGVLLQGVLDPEAQQRVMFEVLMTLVGLQSVHEFEAYMEHHPSLSEGQGEKFAQEIRRTLFAELALYLEGMGDTAPASTENLSTAIQNSPDVQARLAKLPESVQTVVSSQQLEDAFASVQKRHHIEAPTAKALAGQVVRVMVGLSNMNDFKVSVTRVAGIPPSGLDALFLDVEQGLFKPVRTAILNALQKNMGSLPAKEGTQSNDPYRTPAR